MIGWVSLIEEDAERRLASGAAERGRVAAARRDASRFGFPDGRPTMAGPALFLRGQRSVYVPPRSGRVPDVSSAGTNVTIAEPAIGSTPGSLAIRWKRRSPLGMNGVPNVGRRIQ